MLEFTKSPTKKCLFLRKVRLKSVFYLLLFFCSSKKYSPFCKQKYTSSLYGATFTALLLRIRSNLQVVRDQFQEQIAVGSVKYGEKDSI